VAAAALGRPVLAESARWAASIPAVPAIVMTAISVLRSMRFS
jgi:hypothetical protein